MEKCRLSAVLLLAHIGLSSVVLEAQVSVEPQVTGYQGNDVTLRCKLLQGTLIQAEWQWEMSDTKKFSIAVFNPNLGQNISGSPLKGRLEFAGASAGDSSITIKDVEMTDAGKYICLLTVFPSGSFERTTILTVLNQIPPPSSGEVVGIVTAALLVTAVVTATAYLIIARKRHKALFNPSVSIDASSLVVNADRTGRQEDLVYSEIVRFNIDKRKAHDPSGEDQKDADVKPAEDVTYSAVAVGQQHSLREDTVYSQVVRKDWDIDDVWTV
uniref:T-cell immunoreceptor with Ig and ITIM domains-like isoform X1 n=1 Tax=Oncorhynchus gorbuscha TaxID=8017 RepID=UPI001EAEB9B9|nr:T-cell immunoreceptor with Ig and ITIM domains-like isoform X1 [Oncorhynchus gorbuscha]XP_046196092.1 T-cell immunoreceptor with Ig and ITIM domains-like isoform X1 [Oncorhynchus gorbuscha]